jgi:hypothetical protein
VNRRTAELLIALALIATSVSSVSGQRGRGAGAAQPPQSGQAGAPFDLTGYWVAIVNEDWRWRMVTPPKGDYTSVANLLTAEARKIADSWDVSQDGSCLAFGAAGLMRMPTRLHITWETDNVLKIETDSGQQTRRLLFDKSTQAPAAPTLQGFSVAEWERPGRGGGGGGFGGGAPGPGPAGPPAAAAGAQPGGGARGAQPGGGAPGAQPGGGAPGAQPGGGAAAVPPDGGRGGGRGAGAAQNRGGSLKVVTTQLSGGWLRRNGVPYSQNTTLTEYFDRFPGPNADTWLVVTTVVADPKYLTQEFVTSSHFRLEPDGRKWDPAPCKP